MKEKKTDSNRSVQLLLGALFLGGVAAAVLWYRYLHPVRPAPSESGFYYTGVKKSKGDPNLFADEEGVRAAPRPAAPAPNSTGKK